MKRRGKVSITPTSTNLDPPKAFLHDPPSDPDPLSSFSNSVIGVPILSSSPELPPSLFEDEVSSVVTGEFSSA